MGIYRQVNKWLKCIQLFRERLSEKIISYPDLTLFYIESGRGRSGYEIRKKVHATIPKGNMGYDQNTVSDTVADEPTFAASL